MTAFSATPCEPWEPVWCCSPAPTGQVMQATEILWALSGRQFGLCTETYWPCRRGCQSDGTFITPLLRNGLWYNVVCGTCGNDCDCGHTDSVAFDFHIADVIEVVVDGVAVPSGSYRVDDWRVLVRTDGGDWPMCQNYAATGGPDTWYATLRIGNAVPQLGNLAVGEMACHLAKACAFDPSCQLPQRVQTISRQGVSVTFADYQDLFDKGLTGLEMCDLFIRTYNPHGVKEPPRIWSPDLAYPRIAGT